MSIGRMHLFFSFFIANFALEGNKERLFFIFFLAPAHLLTLINCQMDEFKDKLSVEFRKSNNEVIVSTLLPTSVFVDTDVAAIFTYLASRYDVLSFSASLCGSGLDRSVTFSLNDCYFDVNRFYRFLLSL